jgi:hypothetical protein
MECSSDLEMQKIPELSKALFEHVLYDEHPLFVSDEATIFDVSTSTATDLLGRLSGYYRKPVSPDDLKLPLWKLLRQLNGL